MFAKPYSSTRSFTSRSPVNITETIKSSVKKDLPLRSPNKNKGRKPSEVQDPKESSFNPTSMSDTSRGFKDQSNLVSESLFSATLGQDHSSLSMFNIPEEGKDNPERYCKKLLEEVAALRQELAEKNSMNIKLIKENANLRHEMEQFLTTVNDAREFIDIELKDCNQRIQDMELEMHELRTENNMYKEQLKNLNRAQPPKEIQISEVEQLYPQKNADESYSRSNRQLSESLDTSKRQYTKIQLNRNSVSELPKNSFSAIRHSPTASYQVIRPKTPNPRVMAKTDSSRTQGTMTPGRRGTMQKIGVNQTSETTRSPSYRLVKGRNGHASSSQFEGMAGDDTPGSTSQDLGRSKKSLSTVAVSPKMSTLKTKLKSDMILQEMKKKLVS